MNARQLDDDRQGVLGETVLGCIGRQERGDPVREPFTLLDGGFKFSKCLQVKKEGVVENAGLDFNSQSPHDSLTGNTARNRGIAPATAGLMWCFSVKQSDRVVLAAKAIGIRKNALKHELIVGLDTVIAHANFIDGTR